MTMTQKVQNRLKPPIRSEILRVVRAIRPLDDQETEHVSFVDKWIESGAEIFRITKPATPDTHLVSYFILVDQAQNKVLLTDHKKSGLWLPAGGHVELNEHPKETVQREILEELGIRADFLSEDPLFLTVTKTVGETAGHTDVSLWYVLKGNAFDNLNYDNQEFHQIRWFLPTEIPYPRTDPHMSRLMQKLNSLKVLH